MLMVQRRLEVLVVTVGPCYAGVWVGVGRAGPSTEVATLTALLT